MGLLDQHRRELARVYGAAVQHSVASGKIPVRIPAVGGGEVLVDVNFGLTFTKEPIPQEGLVQLDKDFVPVTVRYPTSTMTVVHWERAHARDGFDGYWVGARLALSVTGQPNHQIWCTWIMAGPAFGGPMDLTVVEEI